MLRFSIARRFYPCIVISRVFYRKSVTMPKEGPSSAEWMAKLQDFASGRYKFGKGKKPGKGSKWERELNKIVGCPKHNNQGTLSITGKALQCTCGYHVSHDYIV